MRHTLKEFMNQYIGGYVRLIFAEHIIDIELNKKGSFAIIRAFSELKFNFESFENGLLTLKY